LHDKLVIGAAACRMIIVPESNGLCPRLAQRELFQPADALQW
jgi:hypothetical protein